MSRMLSSVSTIFLSVSLAVFCNATSLILLRF